MDKPQITQQTSVTMPLRASAREAPRPIAAGRSTFDGALQWALEGTGWSVLRPCVEFVLLCVAVVVALGGVPATAQVDSTAAPLLLLPALVMLLLYLRGLYRTRLRALVLDSFVPVLAAVSVGAMAVATIGLFANGRAPGQTLEVRAWLFAVFAVGMGRLVLSQAQRSARKRRLVGQQVLIVGAGMVGSHVARRLETHSEYGLIPIGFIDDDPRPVAEVGGRRTPVLGTLDDLDETVRSTGVRKIIVAFSPVADARLSRLIQRYQELGIEIAVVPRMFDSINNRASYDTLGATPLLTFSTVDPKGKQFALKHAFDRVFAGVMLVLLSPVLLGAALAVRLSSPGPVLFRQRRVGRDGRVFDLYKFRSMRLSSEPDRARNSESAFDRVATGGTAPGGVEGDDRRTLVGRILRRSSIDELPQLLNVLSGEMSIIGPRPERPQFVELFQNDIVRYDDRHRVKSGITGWAQVHGLRGQTSLADRVEWDNYYIAHWSLGLDLKILLLTFAAVFRHAE